MNGPRFAQIFVILCSCIVSTALGQNSYQPTQRPAGHWQSGRYIGYTPKHLQIQPPAPVYAEERSTPSHLPAQTSDDSVAQTIFQEDMPIEDSSSIARDEAISLELYPSHGSDCACVSTNRDAVENCGPLGMWGRVDALLWWTKGMNLPPLVTTSPDGTPQDEAGVLGDPNTTILFGNGKVNEDSRGGGRFTLGVWLDPCQTQGIDVTYMYLGEKSYSFFGSNNDFTILARPFFNADTDQEDSRLIVYPDLVNGNLFVNVTTEFQAAEVLYRRAAVRSCRTQIDYYFGYRFAELKDRVAFDAFTTSLDGPTADSTIDLTEQFDTRNTFNGGQLGLKVINQPTNRWLLELGIKFALGGTKSRAIVAAETTRTNGAGDSTTVESGLLALESNIGNYEETEFSTITEVGINFRRCIQRGVTASIGYTIMYWSDVNRAGDLIDLTVNPTQIPPGTLDGTARPEFAFNSTDFWAQGLNFGMEFNF